MKLDVAVLKDILTNAAIDDRGKNIMAKCPWCGHNEFGVSINNGHPFGCYRKKACGITGNIFKLLKKLGRLDLLSKGTSKVKYSDKLENIIEKKAQEDIDISLPTIDVPLGFKRIMSSFYLESRGFSSFDKYEVGTTRLMGKLKDYVIFLVREDGELKSYISRSTKSSLEIKQIEGKTGKKIPRYSNSKTDFTKLLVGYDEITENTGTVILVEGLFGKENVDRLLELDDQEVIKCCSTSGAKISKEQIFKLQLKGISHVILFFDYDVINKIKKHAVELMSEFESVSIVSSSLKHVDGTYKDPADLNLDEMMSAFNDQKDPINFCLHKIQVINLK